MKKLLLIFLLLHFNSCDKKQLVSNSPIPVAITPHIISCDYGEEKIFVVKSEDGAFYVSSAALYDASGDQFMMSNSLDTFSMVLDPSISDHADSMIPYTVNGNGYSVTQTSNCEMEITIKSNMSYRRIWIFVATKNIRRLPTPIMFIRPDDPDYEYFFDNKQ